MLKIVPKEETDMKFHIRWWIRKGITEACMEHGVPFELADDSVIVQDAVENVVNKIYNLRKTLETQGENTFYTSSVTLTEPPVFKPINPTKQMKKKLKKEKKFREHMKKAMKDVK